MLNTGKTFPATYVSDVFPVFQGSAPNTVKGKNNSNFFWLCEFDFAESIWILIWSFKLDAF